MNASSVTEREKFLSCYVLQDSLIACAKALISSGLRRTLSAPQSRKCSISEGSPVLKQNRVVRNGQRFKVVCNGSGCVHLLTITSDAEDRSRIT
jgi:hypothetical protein